MEDCDKSTLAKRFFRHHRLVISIPAPVLKLISKRTVDITSASPYFRRLATDSMIRIEADLQILGRFRYKFSPPLITFFKCALRELLAHPPADSSGMSPGDFVAQAVYRTAWLYGTPIPSASTDRYQLWPADRDISEAWQRLGNYHPPSGGDIITREELPDGTLRFPSSDFRYPRIAQRITYSSDKQRLPKITIEIEGEPVCVLYRSRYVIRDPDERTAIRDEAKRILSCLRRDLHVTLQVEHSRPNRPMIGLGQEAAYLHDFKRLSWSEVANRMCPRKHLHDFACRTNLRKQAEQ